MYSSNICTEYLFSLQNAVCFIILTYLVPLLFTFYIQLYFIYMIYILRIFFSSKCSLCHNSNAFDSCIIHILYTLCILYVFFSLQDADCFIILTYLVPILFTFYIQVYFIYMIYTLRIFFSSKCSLFHNSNLFGSCIIHILYTGISYIHDTYSPYYFLFKMHFVS